MDITSFFLKAHATKEYELTSCTAAKGLGTFLQNARVHVVPTATNTTTRLHFTIGENVLEVLAEQQSDVKKSTFFEFVYDTNEYLLLSNRLWLIMRQYEGGAIEWRLRLAQKSPNGLLEWFEITEYGAILDIVQTFSGCHHAKILYCCPRVVASMETTRVMLGTNDDLWIDFSSWLVEGTSGMYVVGTSKLSENGPSLRDIQQIFKEQNIRCAPSKFFVCMKDVFPNAWSKAFSPLEQTEWTSALETYPVLRSTRGTTYANFHKLTTVEDLALELADEI